MPMTIDEYTAAGLAACSDPITAADEAISLAAQDAADDETLDALYARRRAAVDARNEQEILADIPITDHPRAGRF